MTKILNTVVPHRILQEESQEVLLNGEIALSTEEIDGSDENKITIVKLKVGDGETAYKDLPYVSNALKPLKMGKYTYDGTQEVIIKSYDEAVE